MATDINDSFIRAYESELIHEFQRMGGYLRPTVRMKDNIVGESTTFQRIGKGTATTKTRHGTITPMNQSHTPITCTLEDFYAGDWVDKLDEAKINIDERTAIAQGGAWALGRKVDEQILAKLDDTTQSAVTITLTSSATILASALEWSEALDGNDVPNDGQRYAVVTPRLHSQLSTVEEFTSADYVAISGTPFNEGAPVLDRWRDWNNTKWKSFTDSTTMGVGTGTAKDFMWHKTAVGFATGAHAGNVAANDAIQADITWHGDRAAHFVNHMMSGGACLIDDTGVIEASHNDTTAIVTS